MRLRHWASAIVLTVLGHAGGAFAAPPNAPAGDSAGTLRRDIEYRDVEGVRLTLDAFVPPGDGPFPTCILVHGGGFTKGDKRSYITPLFDALGKAGFVWFTIDYRLAPKYRWPACADDVEAAVVWVKRHAAEFKVDPRRIALIGESAGGHLVSYVGVRGSGEARVAAVVPFYAPHSLEMQVRKRQSLGAAETGLLGLTELNDDAYAKLRAISPSNYIQKGLPPFLLIHGDQDKQVPFEQSTVFQEQMRAAGNVCELIVVPQGGHGMGGWDKLYSDYREQMIAWLKKTLAETK